MDGVLAYIFSLILWLTGFAFAAVLGFGGASRLLASAKRHQPHTTLEQVFSVKGRWLRYALATILVVVGWVGVLGLLGSVAFSLLPYVWNV